MGLAFGASAGGPWRDLAAPTTRRATTTRPTRATGTTTGAARPTTTRPARAAATRPALATTTIPASAPAATTIPTLLALLALRRDVCGGGGGQLGDLPGASGAYQLGQAAATAARFRLEGVQIAQALDSGHHRVERRGAAKRFGQDIADARGLHDGAHRAASDHAGAWRGRLEQHLRG